MDHGVDFVDGSGEGESKRVVGDGVSEETIVGSEKLKDLEVEEVFEEAMDPQEHLHDQGSELYSGDAVVDKNDDAETGGALDSALVGESTDAAQEHDHFEEAIGVAGEPGKQEETDVVAKQELERDEQGHDSVHLDGVDSGGTGDGIFCDDSHSVRDDNLKSSDWSDEKEVSGLDTNGKMSVKENGAVVDGNSGLVSEKAEIDDSEFVTPRENGGVILENGSASKVDNIVSKSNTESESNEVVENQGNAAGDLKDNGSYPESGDEKIEVKLNASGDPSSEIQDPAGEVHENSTHMNLEHQAEVIRDVKDDSLGTDISHEGRNGEEMSTCDIQTTEFRDYENENAQAGSDSEHREATGEMRGVSPPELHETVQEREVMPAAGSSSIMENSSTDETPSVQPSAADQNGASNTDYQSQVSDEPSLRDNSSVVEEETTQVTRDQNVQPAAGWSSPSENSGGAEDRNGEEKSAHGIQTNQLRDHEKEDAQAELDSERPEATVEIKGASPPDLQERDESSSFLEKSSTGETPSVQASAADKNEASNMDYRSQVSNEPSVRDNSSMVKEETTRVARDKNVQPTVERSSPSDNSAGAGPPPVHPAGLGRAAPLLEPAPRAVQPPRVNGTVSSTQSQQMEDSSNGEAEEYDETREKLQMIRVKFLRLAHRLGQTPHNVVVAQVLYRLGLAEQLRGRNGGRVGAFSFDRASAMAEQLEASGQEPLDFSCTIMVLGKTGVGKSATINSIFDEVKFNTSAFHMGTKKVQDVVGTVQGIKVRVIDTPGLLPSWSDQRNNEKILHSVKNFIKKTPPDIVLYLDRLDMQSRDFSDMPLLRTITEIFGPSIWFNAIVVLTHAASAPPEGPNGTASSYDMFVTQRSHVVQQAIRQAAGDMRLMNPVSLVENHSACRTNRAGQRVLPNGQVWKPHLLLLSFASKILAEANALLKLQDNPPGKPYTARVRAPPLPFLLSTLLQSRPQLKLPEEQFGDEDSLDDDLDESSDSDDETEFDELPPFKPLTKAQVEKLSKAQKKAYFDELEYREKLLMKKQLKEEKKRRKMMKKMAESAKDLPSDYSENVEEESAGAASVPVPMPDLALPASFDSDNPTHRYRYLDSSNQWLVRPVLETHGWDHDVGYEGLNVERLFVVRDKVPLSFTGQITKDKKDANVQMEIASSIKHGEGKATSLGFDMQTVGKDLAYTLRSETRFSNFRRNKATAGLSFTLLGDALSAGMKIEDKLVANKRFKLVISGGAMAGRGDVAYGGSLEAQLRDKDFPLGRFLSTLGLSVMDWHGELAVGCNVQSQIPVGRNTNLVARANLNNRGAGQISIRLNSSEQLQIALVGLIPLLKKLVGYHQQLQYGQ